LNSVSILGCGWLGLPLAFHLKEKGYAVKGSKTTDEGVQLLQEKGIDAYRIALLPEIYAEHVSEFLNSEILIVNFPPKRREDIESFYPEQIQSLINAISGSVVKKVLFVSTTAIYQNLNKEVTEEDETTPEKSSGKAVLKAEQLLQASSQFQTTILRFGGLIGYDRNPGRFLAGKENVSNGQAPVNLIHRDDCISIIAQIVSQNVWGETFNACADEHPTREEFYTQMALKTGLIPPKFADDKSCSFKVINNNKLKQRLHYTFRHKIV
jgi:nucleoside-diphosphate-sugar epimerase